MDKALLDIVLEQTREILLYVDEKGIIRYASPAVECISGYTSKELCGTSIFDYVHPEEKEEYIRQFKQTVEGTEGQQKMHSKVRIKPKNRPYRFIEWATNNQLTHPEIGYVIINLRDVTEVKKTEEELSKSEDRLKQAQEIARLGNWDFSFRTGENTWSDEIYRILGLEPGSIEPSLEAYLKYIHPDDRERVDELIKESKKQNKPFVFTHRILRDDGSVRIVENERRFEFNEQGEPVRMYGILHDITEQVKTQEALKEHAMNLEEAFNIARIGTWKYDIKNDIYDWNESALEVIGFQKDNIPTNWEEYMAFVPEEYREMVQKGISDGNKKGVVDLEHQLEVDGERKWIRVKSNIEFDKQGNAVSVLGVIQDIDVIKRNESKLEKALEEKTALLAEVHHRVKNNLAIISGLLELQRMEAADERVNDSFNQSINRISSIAMVHELLYQSEEFSSVDLHSYLERLIPGIQETMASSHKDIRVKLDIENYQININQAIPIGLLLNELLTNSFKYAFDGLKAGDVHITLNRIDKNKLYICYRDTGVGLPEGIDFEKPENLGLTLIHTQLEQLGAQYDVSSANGFKLELTFKANFRKGQLALPLN